MKKFICYYSKRDKNGELIDDFKEWCNARNKAQAMEIFKDRYPNLSIDLICEEAEDKRII